MSQPALGARVNGDTVSFTVWAPRQRSVVLHLVDREELPMAQHPDGYFSIDVTGLPAGQRYMFRLAEGLRPDPVSRFQPEGVSGPSAVVDPSRFRWTDHEWAGAPPPHRNVVYEMHIGTFTEGGTWAAARERLPQLADVGVTTLEVMPVAEFYGRFGWGYDGVFLFAPFHEYGTPDDARQFVDEAHRLGLSVILDVVYNHLGPVGNWLPLYSDWYFAEHETDWGRGFNVDGEHSPHVRHFMRENVRHWIAEYHFDGLRFDAIHSIVDGSPRHIVNELTAHAREVSSPRRLYVVAENESQNVAFLSRDAHDASALDGIWNEDWHHAAFVALTGQNEAYCSDYQGHASEFSAMARWNLLYQGQWYSWQKQGRGTDARAFPTSAFVCFLENHDQVANTGRGARLHDLANPARWRAMTALLLLGPAVPMLFQGQECASRSPFTYFADQEPSLAQLVRTGRIQFLSQFPALTDPETQTSLPDPADPQTFQASKVDWGSTRASAEARRLHADLLRIRRTDAVLSTLGTSAVTIATSAPTRGVVVLRYWTDSDERLVIANLDRRLELAMADPLVAPPADRRWVMTWCSERAAYGGEGVAAWPSEGRWMLQANCAWLLTLEPREGGQR